MKKFMVHLCIIAAFVLLCGCANRSVIADTENTASSEVVEKWLDFYTDYENMPWGDNTLELELPEFPNVTFTWNWERVTATDHNGEIVLFGGWPIWSVYLTDITGDGLPDFVATVSFGSGIVDTRVLVYDYANNELYDLSDRAVYDYALLMENGNLFVQRTPYLTGTAGDSQKGVLRIIDGKLTMIIN